MPPPTILICDDEPSLRELMQVSLDKGYEFAEAASVSEAIEAADRIQPDLILLDMMMPGGSGLDVLHRLRSDERLAETPVVVVSAFTTDDDRIAAHDAGADGFLGKPFEPEELQALVEQLLTSNS